MNVGGEGLTIERVWEGLSRWRRGGQRRCLGLGVDWGMRVAEEEEAGEMTEVNGIGRWEEGSVGVEKEWQKVGGA